MTAFDNIKTNNWPATSNEFEDFLVLKLPLNDNASLTESLPVVAGSKQLSAKLTGFTNNGVAIEASTGSNKKHYDNHAVLTAASSNYIQTSGLNFPDSNDYTYECWARADGTISSYSLFHTNPTSRAGILFLFGSSTGGQLYFGNGSSWSNYVDLTWSIDSNWHHYAVVRQGGGNVNLYIDGQLNTSFAAGAHTHGELVLGRQSGDNNLYWNGAIQDVRVYKTAKYTSNFTPPGAILG